MICIKERVLEVRISLFSNHTLKNNAQLSGRAAVGHTVTDLEAAHKKYILIFDDCQDFIHTID